MSSDTRNQKPRAAWPSDPTTGAPADRQAGSAASYASLRPSPVTIADPVSGTAVQAALEAANLKPKGETQMTHDELAQVEAIFVDIEEVQEHLTEALDALVNVSLDIARLLGRPEGKETSGVQS